MKSTLSFILALCAICLSAFGQVTTDPPETRQPGFHWDDSPPGHRGWQFGWNTAPAAAMDKDLRDFVKRAALSNPLQISSVSTLVRDLKAAGVWKKLTAFYPFVGDSVSSSAQNLVSAKYPIEWFGSITFDEHGVGGDGASYGDTHYSVRMAKNPNNFHLYGYVSGPALSAGSATPVFGTTACYVEFSGAAITGCGPNTTARYTVAAVGSSALVQRASVYGSAFWTETQRGSYPESGAAPSENTIKVLANKPLSDVCCPGTLRAVSFGSALSEAEGTALFAAVQKFHNSLAQ